MNQNQTIFRIGNVRIVIFFAKIRLIIELTVFYYLQGYILQSKITKPYQIQLIWLCISD